jgi:hypothetical protein
MSPSTDINLALAQDCTDTDKLNMLFLGLLLIFSNVTTVKRCVTE